MIVIKILFVDLEYDCDSTNQTNRAKETEMSCQNLMPSIQMSLRGPQNETAEQTRPWPNRLES